MVKAEGDLNLPRLGREKNTSRCLERRVGGQYVHLGGREVALPYMRPAGGPCGVPADTAARSHAAMALPDIIAVCGGVRDESNGGYAFQKSQLHSEKKSAAS